MNRDRTLPAPVRWLMALSASAILAWASVEAWRAAWASLYWIPAKQELKTWGAGSVPPRQSWLAAWERLERARALEPENPGIHELMGLVAARRSDDYAILKEATSHYLRSLALRPISPDTWASLAEARYLVGDTARMFELAVENAARLGPSAPQTQRVVAHYGLAVLDDVGPSARSAIEADVAAGMRRNPAEMLIIAQRRGRLDVACRYLPETRRKIDPRWLELCAKSATR